MTDAFMGIDQSFGGFAIVIWVPDWNKAETDLKAYPAKTHGGGVDRLKAVSNHIADVAYQLHWEKHLDIKHICMEGYARNSKFRREEAGELAATVKLTLTACFSKPVAYPTIVAPTQLKQFVTGTAKATKDDMRSAVHKRWGEICWDHNIADAYGLARIAHTLHTDMPDPGAPQEAAVLGKLTPHSETIAPLALSA